MRSHKLFNTVNDTIFECELADELCAYGMAMNYTIRKAIEAKVSLVKLSASFANFRGVDFEKVDLTGATFTDVDFNGADFCNANLTGTHFVNCDLYLTNLENAIVSVDTCFVGSKLDARSLDWKGVNKVKHTKKLLANADFSMYKNDLIAQVLKLPNELDALLEAINNGKIDGTTYSGGTCVCLAGTLARSFGTPILCGAVVEKFGTPKLKIPTDSSSPREEWFSFIRPGETPDNCIHAYLAAKWVKAAIAIRDNVIRRNALAKHITGSPMTARAYEMEASETKIILPPTKD